MPAFASRDREAAAAPEALAAWRDLLGAEHVVTAGEALARAAAATFATAHRVTAILRPGSREEVRGCLRIAGRHRAPVYPVSRGKNWGYGSRVPAADGCALLALDRLDRILDFDEQLAYVTVEPGVTFAQVHRFLREQGSRLTLASPGSTPEASVVGNALERGIAGGLDGDRASRVCDLEVALPDGSLIRTGFGRFAPAAAAPVARSGVGPGLEELFLQSNLGVVTRLTLWLTPLPAFYQAFTFTIGDRERLAPLVDALQAVRRDRLLEAGIGLYNACKVASCGGAAGGGAWFGEGALTAPDQEIGSCQRRLLRQRLTGVVDHLAFRAPNAANPLVGPPARGSLASVYHCKAQPPPRDMDPDHDRCGIVWCCPLVPFRGSDVARCAGILEETLAAYGFAPAVGAQCLSPRAVHVVASILYDRETPGSDEAALACHRSMLAAAAGEGFLPYRLGLQGMDLLPPPADDSARLFQILKRAFDPADVLAPGRYDFRYRWPQG